MVFDSCFSHASVGEYNLYSMSIVIWNGCASWLCQYLVSKLQICRSAVCQTGHRHREWAMDCHLTMSHVLCMFPRGDDLDSKSHMLPDRKTSDQLEHANVGDRTLALVEGSSPIHSACLNCVMCYDQARVGGACSSRPGLMQTDAD